MKGLIAAGGKATRLYELTRSTNKHLLPVYDKPMIYYALEQMQNAGIKDVMIVTGKDHAGDFVDLLGNGQIYRRGDDQDQLFDLNITYKVQNEAGGLAQVVSMANEFIDKDEKFLFLLGDNIFEHDLSKEVKEFEKSELSTKIFLSEVPDPERFGVAKFDKTGKRVIEVIEKPGTLSDAPIPSNYAQVGAYCLSYNVFEVIKDIKPSSRGELEITECINPYLAKDDCSYSIIKGWWKDVGTIDSLAEVSSLIMQTGANN